MITLVTCITLRRRVSLYSNHMPSFWCLPGIETNLHNLDYLRKSGDGTGVWKMELERKSGVDSRNNQVLGQIHLLLIYLIWLSGSLLMTYLQISSKWLFLPPKSSLTRTSSAVSPSSLVRTTMTYGDFKSRLPCLLIPCGSSLTVLSPRLLRLMQPIGWSGSY